MSDEVQNPNDNPTSGPDQTPQPSQPTPQPNPAPTPNPAPVPPPSNPANIAAQPITRAATEGDAPVERRVFIKWLAIGWTAFAAILAGYGTLVLRFLFPNVLFEPKQSFLAGFPDEYEVGNVSERYKAKHGVWIVRDVEKIYVLSTVCTHLGCTPNWLESDSKFKCPCHGSGFYKTGLNFEGPAPRPLERFKIGLNDDGEILVDKTKKFQQEKGEWDDPESYLLA